MLAEQRRVRELALLSQRRAVRVEDLAGQFSVSSSTIRRDLDELEREGLVRRVHGGAMLKEPVLKEPVLKEPVTGPGASQTSPAVRHVDRESDKQALAHATVPLIEPDSTVLVGGGSTTAALVPLLHQVRGLTVVTNSLDLAHRLAADDVHVIVLGGLLRRPELSLLGHIVELALRELRIDQAIMGAYAISAQHGLLAGGGLEGDTNRRLAYCAPRLTILADDSKFDRRSPYRIAPAEHLTDLVVSNGVPPEEIESFQNVGVIVHLVATTGSMK